tara:strand:+ start:2099 stop:2449 length:351 start_codon:yes stop_codon:yes gene_type:complete
MKEMFVHLVLVVVDLVALAGIVVDQIMYMILLMVNVMEQRAQMLKVTSLTHMHQVMVAVLMFLIYVQMVNVMLLAPASQPKPHAMLGGCSSITQIARVKIYKIAQHQAKFAGEGNV